MGWLADFLLPKVADSSATYRPRPTRPPMLLIVSKTFRAIGTHANDNERRDQSCLAIEPHPHHGAIKDESHDRFIGGWEGINAARVVCGAHYLRRTPRDFTRRT
jgi:hypothetical protein